MEARPNAMLFAAMLMMLIAAFAVHTAAAQEAAAQIPLDAAAGPIGDAGALLSGLGVPAGTLGAPEQAPAPAPSSAAATFPAAFACSAAVAIAAFF